MKTVLELFLLTRIPEGFHVVRKALDMTQESRDPDKVADEYIQFLFQDSSVIHDKKKYILHSTSWRYDPPQTIILTYLVYAASFSFKQLNPFLLRFEQIAVAQTDNPKVPRPKNLTQISVISHGIRHLAYLISNDINSAFKNIVSAETHLLFQSVEKQLAGEIS